MRSWKSIPDACGLVTNNSFKTKIKEIEDKIPDHDKYINTNEFNKFSGAIFDERF